MEKHTERDIEKYFKQGEIQADIEENQNGMGICPYRKNSIPEKWWNRGYNYQYRLIRALQYLEKLENTNIKIDFRSAASPD